MKRTLRNVLPLLSVLLTAGHLNALSSERGISGINTPVSIDTAKHETSHGLSAIEKGSGSTKICSCQILDLQSNNYQYSHMAVLAEKTNYGDFSAGVVTARQAIEKEKKHLRLLFFDRMKVVDRVNEAMDCRSLFAKLKLQDNSLVMYDVLDADQGR